MTSLVDLPINLCQFELHQFFQACSRKDIQVKYVHRHIL